MLAAWKAVPILPKILIVFLVLGCAYKIAHLHSAGSSPASLSETGYDVDQTERSDSTSSVRSTSGRSGAGAQLAQFQQQQAQLLTVVRECQQQMTEATNRMREAAIQGQFYNGRPACEANMPMWIAQESYLETEIYRIQTGDHRSTVREITGVTGGSSAEGRTGSGSVGRSDDGTGAVENYDRQGIRGNSLYTDETGEERELPTYKYYFRDRTSGQMMGSDQPNPPNNGHDYEVIEPEPQN